MLTLLAPFGALDDLWELIRRIQEWLTLGGMALAAGIALLFLGTWVITHLRKPAAAEPSRAGRTILATLALWSAYVPVLLTLVAAAGLFVPGLQPFILKCFALAVVAAALSWCLATAAILAGGTRRDLSRARRALLLAGTPWYCLVAYLAVHL